MDENLRLGRIAGFPVGMNWSVLVVVWLVTWSLATVALPEAAKGYPDAAYWVAGAAGALLFFASLLAHEVAHAVVARHHGIEVTGLTLWLFGGVATLRGTPRTPRDDFRIAGVGPLVSLTLAAAYGAIAVLLNVAGASRLVRADVTWLAAINVMLGLFNLVPGAPLDGGRLLRAALWRRSGDRDRAAVSAARAGRTTGLVLIGLGLLEVLAGGLGGIWLAFIGWFIRTAAQAEETSVTLTSGLAGLHVADVMTPEPETLPAWFAVADLAERLPPRVRAAYPVVGLDGAVEGLVTLDRLRAVPPAARATTRVGSVAIPLRDIPVAAPGDELTAVLDRFTPASGGRLLVLDGGVLVGLVTADDLARAASVRGLRARTPEPVG